MITDEEIQASVDMHISENEDGDCVLEPFAFARAIYQLGRQHQRESDAELCFKLAEQEYLPSMREYTEAGMCYAECEEMILANTGEPK